jgi:translation initiation factor 2 subunit 2
LCVCCRGPLSTGTTLAGASHDVSVLQDEEDEPAPAPEATAAEEDELNLDLDLSKKKKKKKKSRKEEFDLDEDAGDGAAGDAKEEKTSGNFAWSGTERDYSYEEMLGGQRRCIVHRVTGMTGVQRLTAHDGPDAWCIC